jgi:hypothetical protein
MTISDPEYAPVYYKVMALDTTGIAAKCVQPLRISTGWIENNRTPLRTQTNKTPPAVNTTSTDNSPATFPNNISLGTGGAARNETTACFLDVQQKDTELVSVLKYEIFYPKTSSVTMKIEDFV